MGDRVAIPARTKVEELAMAMCIFREGGDCTCKNYEGIYVMSDSCIAGKQEARAVLRRLQGAGYAVSRRRNQ